MKQWLKRLAMRLAPATSTAILAARARRNSQRLLGRLGVPALNRKLTDRFGHRVVAGPFAGMTLSPATSDEHLGPMILGTYESELHPIWERLTSRSFSAIWDVGAKCGYYVTGFARQYPNTPVVAFDPDPWAQATVREMAIANDRSNIMTRGFCSPRDLANTLPDNALVISDCEGYEVSLFSGDLRCLKSAVIVIETHDPITPDATKTLCERFTHTHRITTVVEALPSLHCQTDLTFLTIDEQTLAINELRSFPALWLVLEPI